MYIEDEGGIYVSDLTKQVTICCYVYKPEDAVEMFKTALKELKDLGYE